MSRETAEVRRYTKDYRWARLDLDGSTVILGDSLTLGQCQAVCNNNPLPNHERDAYLKWKVGVGSHVKRGQCIARFSPYPSDDTEINKRSLHDISIENTKYTAPFDGTIVEWSSVERGQSLARDSLGDTWVVKILPDRNENFDKLLTSKSLSEHHRIQWREALKGLETIQGINFSKIYPESRPHLETFVPKELVDMPVTHLLGEIRDEVTKIRKQQWTNQLVVIFSALAALGALPNIWQLLQRMIKIFG